MIAGTETLFLALLGGILPAVAWLGFWLREDARPEPRRLIMRAFVAGMFAVPIVLFLEEGVARYSGGTAQIWLWAAIEEIVKFAVAYVVVLRRRENDEPIDPIIYMITAALGFAAIENSLFLITPLEQGHALAGIVTGNLRFFGATLLHTLSSAVIGLAMALPFYRRRILRREVLLCGIVLAIMLHALFNLLILGSSGRQLFFVFSGVWVGLIAVIIVFEKVKRVKRPQFVYLRKK